MNKAAIWHEATQRYCFCLEPGRFLFRRQTGAETLQLPELAGRTDLITGEVFGGTLTGFRAMVFATA